MVEVLLDFFIAESREARVVRDALFNVFQRTNDGDCQKRHEASNAKKYRLLIRY